MAVNPRMDALRFGVDLPRFMAWFEALERAGLIVDQTRNPNVTFRQCRVTKPPGCELEEEQSKPPRRRGATAEEETAAPVEALSDGDL